MADPAHTLAAGRCNQNLVFNPDKTFPRDIHTGFNGEDHTRLEGSGLARSQEGTFMHIKTDAVPQFMDESVTITGIGQNLSGSGISPVSARAGYISAMPWRCASITSA